MVKDAFNRVGKWADGHFIGATLTGLVVLFLFVFYFGHIFVTVPPGHGAVLWSRFFGGTEINSQFGEGTKVIFPWDRLYIYDLRLQQSTENLDVLTKEGLQITVSATLRFRVNPKAIGVINAKAGPSYVDVLVVPSVGAAARMEAAKYTLEEIYSSARTKIEQDVQTRVTKVIDDLIQGNEQTEPEIYVEDFWFRSIKLPKALEESIEHKLTQRQIAEQYVYVLQREEQEKKRKQLEAEGIKAFQDIVSSGISENYLRWKGIDATLKLAESHNAKVVVIGSSKEGLPLILGPLDSGTAGAPSMRLTPPPATAGALAPPLAVTPPPTTR